jgi:glutamate 5-kinase|tara:strand:+ start:1687 stop:2820 length:1134 start_codon:yes stop_codon:yes gene_type:complete
MEKYKFSDAKRVVIKLGSSLVTNESGLNEDFLSDLIKQIAFIVSQGVEVLVVTSGAVAAGIKRLELKKRPKKLSQLQAAAAVGQMDLSQIYQKFFFQNNLVAAQILLTHDDLSDRKRYLNARSTICSLISDKVIPVINENDTVATDEIRFGDNDNLAAMVSNLVEADCLLLLTDEKGLYTEDPKKNNKAELIKSAFVDDKQLDKIASGTFSDVGTGGMTTKIEAARRAALSGTHTIIASGKSKNILESLYIKNNLGTFLRSRELKLVARKKWLADNLKSNGKLFIDEGAVNAVMKDGKSLLSVGVLSIEGKFDRGEVVDCFDGLGKKIARGLVNYNSVEVKKIIGQSSDKIESILGYINESNLIHRNNLVITLGNRE